MVRDLERCRNILLDISEREDCAELTHYPGYSVKIFVGGLDRAIKRYKSEAKRVRKYYRR